MESKNLDQFEGGGGEALLSKVKVDEDADKCCFCVPIDIGIIIIGCLFIASGLS